MPSTFAYTTVQPTTGGPSHLLKPGDKLPNGAHIIYAKRFSHLPGDAYLGVVLAFVPQDEPQFATWLYNADHHGCCAGAYFDLDEFAEAVQDFRERGSSCRCPGCDGMAIEKASAAQPRLTLHEGLPVCSCGAQPSVAWEDCGRKWHVCTSHNNDEVSLEYTGETDDGDSGSAYLLCSGCGASHYLADYPDITIDWR